MQYFKGDDTEKKYVEAFASILENIAIQRDLFNVDAYQACPLGDLLWEDMRAPLAKAIKKEIFRKAFGELVEAFFEVGTFEAYLTVFQKIFGDDVGVEFTVPGPGQLKIVIAAAGFDLSDLAARRIEGGEYSFDELVDDEGDNIIVQTIIGFQSQYELEQMLFEMVPAGIFTDIDLTVGS